MAALHLWIKALQLLSFCIASKLASSSYLGASSRQVCCIPLTFPSLKESDSFCLNLIVWLAISSINSFWAPFVIFFSQLRIFTSKPRSSECRVGIHHPNHYSTEAISLYVNMNLPFTHSSQRKPRLGMGIQY